MSQQSEIFSIYRSFLNSKTVKPFETETSRKLNNLNFVDFLFELVKATKGQKEFKNIILKGSLAQAKKSGDLNKIIRDSIFQAFGCNESLIIQSKYTTKSNIGIPLDKSIIDPFGLFGFDPDTSPGNYVYEGNNVNKHVNYLLYKSQGVTKTNPLMLTHKNNILFSVYSISPSTINFSFGEYYDNKEFSVWLNDYLDAINPYFNFVNFTTILTDIITGAISIKGRKNLVEFRRQSTLIRGLQKIFGFCNEEIEETPASSANSILRKNDNQQNFNGDEFTRQSINFGNDNIDNDNPFNFNFEDLDAIEKDATLRSGGKVIFSTCGDLEINVNPDFLLQQLSNLFDLTNNDEFYSYDDNQAIKNLTHQNDGYDNTIKDPNLDQTTNFFDSSLKDGISDLINSGESDLVINLPNINAELQLNILKAIPYALMQMILTPKIMLIPKIHCALSGGNCDRSVNDYLVSLRGVISPIGNTISDLLIKNIFNTIISDIKRLTRDLSVQYIKQRGADYAATIQFLIRLIKSLKRIDDPGCRGVLTSLLRLLKFTNLGIMPPIPGPLILLGGALKPGLNSVAVINEIKSNLLNKGIETAPLLPDGSPNNMIIAIEETVKVMISSIKNNSSVQVFGVSAAGPVKGYAQIQ